MAAASVLVLGVTALFLLGPQSSPKVSFSLTSYSITSNSIVVYGKVTHGTQPVSGATVKLSRFVNGVKKVLAQVPTNSQGLYRVPLPSTSSFTLYVRINKILGGTHYVGSTHFLVKPGFAYDLSAQLTSPSSVFFFPVSSY
jgi:hypothetical protein